MADQIAQSARFLDLSPRIAFSKTVVGSPAAATETIVASVTIPTNLTTGLGVLLFGYLAYTLGTSAASARIRLKQTDAAGATIADSGVMTGGHNTATQLVADDIHGFDATTSPAAVYVMTLTIGSGAAVSTVSSVLLAALVI